VYDRTVAGQSTTFSFAADGSDDGNEGAGETRVDGVLCYPSVTRATRDHVHVAVNGRPLVDESLRRAVVAGYGSLLPQGRAPVAVVRLALPPESVDHNVHPAKAEVALRDDSVYERVEQSVRDALSTADLRRSGDVAMDLETSLRPLDGSSKLGDVTVIGQFRELYLLCAADDDLLVVDQHAAHERINYERLRAAVGDVPSVAVDPPVTLSVSAAEASLVDSLAEELGALGYEASTFGGGTIRVSRVPAPLGRTAAPESLRAVLAALDGGEGETPERVRGELLKELACHPSLKAGQTLSVETGEQLVERLGACDQPYACPHGRPTVLAIDEETLVRGFERENTRFG
jgi:DNA mismatch repair protein MutL